MTNSPATKSPGATTDLLRALKQTLLNLRGLHLQARAAMLATQQIIGSMKGSEPHFDDFAAVANALAELNLAMGREQVALLDQIHAAELATAKLH